MASTKEMQQTSRPLTHRPSISSPAAAAGIIAPRQAHSRNNSHSVLSGSLNASHRVSRRKSMTGTSSAAAVAAVAAAVKEGTADTIAAVPIAGARRNTVSKPGVSRSSLLVGSLPSPPASLPTHKFLALAGQLDLQGSAIDDLHDASDGETAQKGRVRRASDGQPLKEGRKTNRVELRCETCGKGYKHSSCLTKHLWEHTPEWSITSKLLISKHQQVQLLEAASVLMTINSVKDTASPPESASDFASDRDSNSPAEWRYSDQQDGRSSAHTTPPPPPLDGMNATHASYRSLAKRYSSGSGFSRSYQSAPSAGSAGGSVPNGHGFGHHRQLSDHRPTSSGSDVAAAMELLSASLGSNSGRTVHLPPDAPPVPPVPAQYLDQTTLGGTGFINSFPNRAPESFTRGELRRDDSKMDWSGDEDDDMQSRARSDDDDDLVFGRMEE